MSTNSAVCDYFQFGIHIVELRTYKELYKLNAISYKQNTIGIIMLHSNKYTIVYMFAV